MALLPDSRHEQIKLLFHIFIVVNILSPIIAFINKYLI